MRGGERHPILHVALSAPVEVGAQREPLTQIGLSEPTLGDLRGLSLGALLGSAAPGLDGEPSIDPLRADVDQWCTLLARIAVPRLTQNDVGRIAARDLLAVVTAGVPLLVPGEGATP